MNRLARLQRLWASRRLALLGGCALAAAGAIGFQVARLRLDPNGAAVHGVALFVNLIVLVILLRLVRLHVGGPGLEAPAGERHAHRASMREAPTVAIVGAVVASLLALATPRLVVDERPGTSRPVVLVPESDPPRRAPIEVSTSIDVKAVEPVVSARVRPASPVGDLALAADAPLKEKLFVNFQDHDPELLQETPPRPRYQEPVDPTEPSRTDILRIVRDEPPLPPLRVGFGAMLVTAAGDVQVEGSSGRFALDVGTYRGETTFEAGIDLGAEFSLTADSALKIMYAGMSLSEHGRLSSDTEFGTVTGAAGDEYQFDLKWSHLYAALAKRLVGYAPDSWFDLSVHAGGMIDHTIAEFEASGVSAESQDGERGWFALAAGLSLAARGPGPVGFVFELAQSAPLNLGGQSINLTDIRAGFTLDLSDGVADAPGASLFLGYRYMQAVYQLFDEAITRKGSEKSADLMARGPIIGFDVRF